jgi:hypothetical protein
MAEITINNYSLGWLPGEDPIQGRKNGLLQMDNVELDSNGALILQGGTNVKWSGFPANAHTLFSTSINNSRHDYSLLADGSGYRDQTSLFASGGETLHGAFGTAFNFTLVASGAKLYKDTGAAIVNLGVNPPTVKPTATQSILNFPGQQIGDLVNNYVAISGTVTTPVIGGFTYLQMATAAGILSQVQTYNGTGAPHDATVMTGVGAGNVGGSTDDDVVVIQGYTTNPGNVTLLFDVLLVAGDNVGTQVTDFFRTTIVLTDQSFDPVSGVFTIRVRRADFERFGSKALDWTTVYGFRVTYIAPPGNTLNLFGAYLGNTIVFIEGGTRAQFGTYQYAQVNVNNTGSYLAKSILGPATSNITINANQALITAQDPTAIDSQVNEVWIYRKGGLLEQWYRVLVIPIASIATPVYDTFGDQDALTLNQVINLNLISIRSVPDDMYDIIGPVSGRWYYFTENFMYPSEINDPDLVDSSIAIRLAGSNSELLMWARQVSDSMILVGTSIDVYTLTGTFATFPDGSVDIYYRPMHCRYPPITKNAAVYGGSVYYLASDGWRILSPSGANQSLVSPNLDRLYRGETLQGYEAPNLKVIPRSVTFPIVISENKMWCFITGLSTPRVEIYDFVRQYWRVSKYGLGDVSAATFTQDGQIIAFYTTDKKIREFDIHSSTLIDGATKQNILIKTMVMDGQLPHNRKDSSTFKIRLINDSAINCSIIPDATGVQTTFASTAINALLTAQLFDISQVAVLELVKTYQVVLSGSVGSLTIDDIHIIYDARPEQRTFIRIQGQNYGTTARKRIATIPFQLDSLGGTVTINSFLDGINLLSSSFNSTRKTSFNLEFAISNTSLPVAKDYEYTIYSPSVFEFFGFQEPRIIEIYQQQVKAFNIPVTNFGNANKKRIRVWPFIISSPVNNTSVIFTPLIDGSVGTPTTFVVSLDKLTYRHFFKTDVFGVDYGGYFTSNGEFEIDNTLPPEIVQVLPIAKQFDQIGPDEFFRYGKVKQIELRVLPEGTNIPYAIYFNDNNIITGNFTVVANKEASYFLMMPKGVSGNIIRVELGPTSFDFHRFYMRFQVVKSGSDTELEWLSI